MKNAERVSTVACPTCNGPLSPEGQAWACEVGHGFNFADLTAAQGEAVIRSLWYSLRALQDRAIASNLMAIDYDKEGSVFHAARLRSQGIQDLDMVEQLHELVRGLESDRDPIHVLSGSGSDNEGAGSGSHSEPGTHG